MINKFEQFNLFEEKTKEKPSFVAEKNKSFSPFPNILVECLTESQARSNAVYYLRILSKTGQKRLAKKVSFNDKKNFFHILLSELAIKKGRLPSPLACRNVILAQTFSLHLKK